MPQARAAVAARTTVARQEERRLGTGGCLSIDDVSRPRLEPFHHSVHTSHTIHRPLTCDDASGADSAPRMTVVSFRRSIPHLGGLTRHRHSA